MTQSMVLSVRVPENVFMFVREKGGASYVRATLKSELIEAKGGEDDDDDVGDDEDDDDDEPTEILPPDWKPSPVSVREVGEGLLF